MLFLTICGAIFILGILIAFHEFGHFIIAKKSGIKVEEFSIGLGPKILEKKIRSTLYKICIIPFGGYVKLKGMWEENIEEKEGDEFESKGVGVKVGTLLGGSVFNCILALLIFCSLPLIVGVEVTPTTVIKETEDEKLRKGDKIVKINNKKVKCWEEVVEQILQNDSCLCVVERSDSLFQVILTKNTKLSPLIPPILGKIISGGPADKVGLKEGDLITKINNTPVEDWIEFTQIIQNHPEETLKIEWYREGEIMDTIIVPIKAKKLEKEKMKEVGMIKVKMYMERERLSLLPSLREGVYKFVGIFCLTFRIVKQILTKKISPKETIGGPLSIVKMTEESIKYGVEVFVYLIGFISLQLVIVNLIPFPPLDGGCIILVLIEKLKGSPISVKTIKLIQNIGAILLILLLAYITLIDINRLIK